MSPPTIVAVSPHPDDEILGPGATLALSGAQGWRVMNFACSLGRPVDHARRLAELTEAATLMRFETIVMDPPGNISASDDHAAAQRRIGEALGELICEASPAIVVSPHPHDGHHGHEIVARATMDAISTSPSPPIWWMWGLWAELPLPTVYVPFGEPELSILQDGISAYAGENARNRYDLLLPARAISATVLGTERVFGFGAERASGQPYAELLTEVRYSGDRWNLGTARVLNPENPMPTMWSDVDVTDFLTAPSVRHSFSGVSAMPG